MIKRATKRKGSKTFGNAINTWALQHIQAFLFSLGQTYKTPLGSLLTIAVIGVSLSLPTGLYITLKNIQKLTTDWSGTVQITLYLKLDTSDTAAASLVQDLIGHKDIDHVALIDRDEALREYKQNSGFGKALDGLEENPLPHVLLIQPKETSVSAGNGGLLLEYLHKQPIVETAQFDRQWANRLFAIINIFQRGVYILTTLLAFAVLLIIGNTIRLAIFNRRAEIEINKLFGATNAFIQRPFLYSGLIHGVGGSIMAWILIYASTLLLKSPAIRLTRLYDGSFQLASLSLTESLILLVVGGLLGFFGSWFAVQRHIKNIGLS